MSAPNPSWYDLLGVDQDAPAPDIRAAWKSGIAELDPSDRRFRMLNQAAEVLLDEQQRATYDLTLPSQPAPEAQLELPLPTHDVPTSRSTGRGVPGWLVAGLGILAALLIGGCLYLWQTAPPSQKDVDAATADAQAAAERGIVAVVSYDYRSLDDDQAKARTYMTDDFKKQYDPLFAVIRENAPETKTVISTEVVASSVVRSGDNRVQVFMFINTPTLKADLTAPEVFKNQVTVTMEKVGDEWLVDDLKTNLPTG